MKSIGAWALGLAMLGCGGAASTATRKQSPEAAQITSEESGDELVQVPATVLEAPWWFRRIVSPNDRFVVTQESLQLRAYKPSDVTMAGHEIAPRTQLRLARVRCDVDGNTGRAKCENHTLEDNAAPGGFAAPQLKELQERFKQCAVATDKTTLDANQLRDLAEAVVWHDPEGPASLGEGTLAVVEVLTNTKQRVSRNDCSGHFDSCKPGEPCHPCDPAGPPWVINRFETHTHRRQWAMMMARPAGPAVNLGAAHYGVRVPLVVFGSRKNGWLEPSAIFRTLSFARDTGQPQSTLAALDAFSPADTESTFVVQLTAFMLSANAGLPETPVRAATALATFERLDWNAVHFEFRKEVLPIAPTLLDTLGQYASGELSARDPCASP